MSANTPLSQHFQSNSRYLIGFSGVFALLLLAFLCLWTLFGTGISAALLTQMMQDSYLAHVIVITVKQALLSVGFATVIGVLGALAFHRRGRFFGRSILLLTCFSAMIMPSTVAALSLLKLWGQSGLIAQTPLAIFLPDRLGLWSVVLAHVFFNAPLVMRVCLTALDNIPLSQRRSAALLCLSPWAYWSVIDWPTIRAVLPAIMGLVFLLCATSFSLVLMLGGGPSVTTLEVSIYTSLRFEFNLPKAAFLSFLQLVLCGLLLQLFGKTRHSITALSRPEGIFVTRADANSLLMRLCDGTIICGIILLNIVPIMLLIFASDLTQGLPLLMTDRFWSALTNSVTLALGASFFALILAFLLGFLAYEAQLRGHHWVVKLSDFSQSLFLIIPALVLGTALFILLRAHMDVSANAFWILLLGNGLLALPFCYRLIVPALMRHLAETAPLVALWHISAMRRYFTIIIPSLRTEIGFALGLSAALSFGDLGIITLFGSQSFETLPYMLFSFLNRYGAKEADLLALILVLLAIGLYLGAQKAVGYWARHTAQVKSC